MQLRTGNSQKITKLETFKQTGAQFARKLLKLFSSSMQQAAVQGEGQGYFLATQADIILVS